MRKLAIILSSALALSICAQPVRGAQGPGKATVAVLNGCLYDSPEALRQKGVIAERVKTLSVDGHQTAVDEVLCITAPRHSEPDEAPSWGWYRLDRTHPDYNRASIGIDFGSGGEVIGLHASPGGKYLAIEYSAEGHPTIEVVDLPALMRDGVYKTLGTMGVYPGYVSSLTWDGSALRITSDTLLGDPGLPGRRPDLFSEETFSWDIETERIVPLRAALRDPVRYYCDGLRLANTETRAIGLRGLSALRNSSAVVCLEAALSTERDEVAKTEIREVLEELARTKMVLAECLAESVEALKANGIVAEPIKAVFVDGRTDYVNRVLCILNPTSTGRWRRGWYLLDRATPVPDTAALELGDGDKVEMLRPSPDGKYLAVQYARAYSESVTYVEIVDLPALMQNKTYKKIQAIHGYPGSVRIQGWSGGALEVTSDALLSRPPVRVGEYESHLLPLLAEETFSWSSDTGNVSALSEGLQNPAPYYCAALLASQIETRRKAVQGLTLLEGEPAALCLDRHSVQSPGPGARQSK